MISGGNRAWQSVSLSAGAALDRLSDRIAACRNWLFLAALLLLAAALPTAGRLTFDQTIESFFAPQHPDIQLLKRTREVFGGDEFVIVLGTLANPQAGIAKVQQIQAALAQPIQVREYECSVAASIGITFSEGQYSRAED